MGAVTAARWDRRRPRLPRGIGIPREDLDATQQAGTPAVLACRFQPEHALSRLIDKLKFVGHWTLLLVQFSARIQVVEIQDRIEYEEVTAFRLTAPERISRE